MRKDFSAPQLLRKAIRATLGLAAARIALRTITPEQVLLRNVATRERASREARASDPVRTARVCDEAAFFISRIALRLPWRSDCLVQALAGQHWLANEGIASEIVVGTAKQADGGFLSHAWLKHETRIVLGGDISIYTPLLGPNLR